MSPFDELRRLTILSFDRTVTRMVDVNERFTLLKASRAEA